MNKEEPGIVSYKKYFSHITVWEKCSVLKKGVTIQNLKIELLVLPGVQQIKENKKNLWAMIEFVLSTQY